MPLDALFFLAAFLAEVIGTMAGFGSSTVFLPLALLFVDFPTALVLVAILHISGNIGRITFFRHGLDTGLILRFGIPSVIATLAGALLVSHLPQAALRGVLGVFLVCYAAMSLAKPGLKFAPTKTNCIAGGSLSGFFAGLIGTGGALRGAFLTAFSLKKEVYIATAAAIALAVDVTRIPIYFGSGFLEERFYAYVPVLFVIAIAGSYAGKRVVGRVKQKPFRKFVLAAIAAVSLKFIYDGVVFFL